MFNRRKWVKDFRSDVKLHNHSLTLSFSLQQMWHSVTLYILLIYSLHLPYCEVTIRTRPATINLIC